MIRAWTRGGLILGLTGLLLPVYLIAMPLGRHARWRVAALWFSGCCDILGLAIRVSGWPRVNQGTIHLSNHVSYLDILVLGRLIDGTFVAKSEVARWPLIGWLARLTGTEFVSRRLQTLRADCQRLERRLGAGDGLILFPEGTSSDGRRVLPFHSSLLKIAEASRSVQPVSVAYVRRRDGSLLADPERDAFAWFGDMTLLPHLGGVLAADGVEVEVIFHPPLSPAAFADRKALAARCESRVAEGVSDLLAGRRRGEALLPGERPAETAAQDIFAIG